MHNNIIEMVLGGKATSWLIGPLGVYQILLIAAILLILSLIVANVIDSRERHRAAERAKVAEEPIGKGGAFQLVLKNKYLLLIALLMLFLNWVNTTGEYILGRTIKNAAEKQIATQVVPAPAELKGTETTTGLSEEEQKKEIGKYIGKFYGLLVTEYCPSGAISSYDT